MHKIDRRNTLKVLGSAALAGATGLAHRMAFATTVPTMVTVVKIAGIPWFNAVEKGIVKGAKDFNIDASMIGPANVDPAQQVKLLDDLIAKKVTVIGLVPLDVKVCEPVLKRAQAAGIRVITHEGPEQEGRDWNVELIDSVRFGEVQMQRLAKDLNEEGDYVVYVGTLTTPLHNKWADAAIAYQKAHYPKMKLVADRFPGADEIDTSYKTSLDVIIAVSRDAGAFRMRRALALIVGGVKHQFRAVAAQQAPVKKPFRVKGRMRFQLELKQFTVKVNRRRHIVDLNQRADSAQF